MKLIRKIKIPLIGALMVAMVSISVISLSGCSSGGQSATDSTSISFTDVAGKSHTFDKPVEKAVIQWSGSGGPFMVMSALLGTDVDEHIAGMDNGLIEYRADMWNQFLKSVPELESVPQIGTLGEDFDTEGVLSSDADVAIFPIGLKESASEVETSLENAGIPVVYIDYHDETEENHVLSTQILGKLFGKEERAEEICDFYKEHRKAVEDKVEEILKSKERPKLYIEVAMGGPEEYGNTFSNSYSWGGISYDSGAYSIGEDALGGSTSGSIDPEYLLSADPDKIVFAGSYWPSAPTSIRMGFESDEATVKKLIDAYESRSGWESLSAWKNKDIYVCHHGLAREMYDVACYEFYAKACYPEECKDFDPTATLKEYYEKFLPYEFDGLWFYSYKGDV